MTNSPSRPTVSPLTGISRLLSILRGTLIGVLVAIAIIVAGLVALALSLLLWMGLWILNLPNRVGKRWGFETWFRAGLYRVVDRESLISLREEFLEVMHPKKSYPEELDEWGLRREIDRNRREAIEDLRDGEQLIAVIGGVTAIVTGTVLGLAGAGVVVTLVVLFYTFAVTLRILVVDSLAYSGTERPGASVRQLGKMATWNHGPLRGKGGMAVVFGSIISPLSPPGQQLGMELFDRISSHRFDYNTDKWRSDSK